MKTTMLASGSWLYAFRGDRYVCAQIPANPASQSSYPLPIVRDYPVAIKARWALPEPFTAGIDAAIQIGQKCYFFSGTRMIRLDHPPGRGSGSVDTNYRSTIAELPWSGFGSNGIDAIVARADYKSGLAFEGNKYIEFAIANDEIGPPLNPFPKFIGDLPWNGFGIDGIDSAILLDEAESIVVFAGASYILLSDDLDPPKPPPSFLTVQNGPWPFSSFFKPPPPLTRTLLIDRSKWMSAIDPATPIYQMSLPGTHDSGSVNSWIRTPYATQSESITTQLNNGVRLLDIRLRVDPIVPSPNTVALSICHGNWVTKYLSSWLDAHSLGPFGTVYGPLAPVIDEIKAFLIANSTEFVAVSFKIDDWGPFKRGDSKVKDMTAQAIDGLLGSFRFNLGQASPLLSALQQQGHGQVFVLDRIFSTSVPLGLPVEITHNTSGRLRMPTSQPLNVWVQDEFENLASPEIITKVNLVLAAAAQRANNDLVLNFASAVWGYQFAVQANWWLLYQLTNNPKPAGLGWIFFDYALYGYSAPPPNFMFFNCVDMVISANEKPVPYSSFSGVKLTF